MHCTFKGIHRVSQSCCGVSPAALAAASTALVLEAYLSSPRWSLIPQCTKNKILSVEAEPKLTGGYELNLLPPQEEQSQTRSSALPGNNFLPPPSVVQVNDDQ